MPLVLFLSFSVCRAKKKSSNNYIYLKRARETLSNSLSLFSSERKGSLFTRAKSIQIGIRIGANCEVFVREKSKKRRGVLSSRARERTIRALCVIALDIRVYKYESFQPRLSRAYMCTRIKSLRKSTFSSVSVSLSLTWLRAW